MTQNQLEARPPATRATVLTKNRVDVATEVSHRIGRMLSTRNAPKGSFEAKVEDKVKGHGSRLWAIAKKRPFIGVAMASGGALAVAMAIGGGEITLAVIVGYAAYQVLREGVPPKEAAEEAFKAIEA